MKTQSRLTIAITALLASTMLLPAIADEEAAAEQPVGPISGDNPNIGIKYDKKQGLHVTPFLRNC